MISLEQKEALQPIVEKVVNHHVLKPYYEEGFEIYNEHDILMHNSQSIRPDRMCIRKNEVTLLDYKTGRHQKQHYEQLNTYEEVLQTMDYNVSNKLLVYINNDVEVVSV